MAEGAGFYQSMEDKYYDFLDMLDSKGIPIYKVVNAIEAQNIPSFPVAIAFSLIVLALLVWGISGLLLPAGAELTVIVEDSQGYDIEGAIVTVTPQGSSALSPLATNTDGEAKFNVPMNVPLAIGAKKQGYGSANESFTATQGTATVSVTLTEEGGTEHRIINLVKAGTSELVTGFVEIEFSCSGNSWSQEKSTTSGVIEIEVPSDCGTLYAFPGTGWTTGSGGQDNFDFESRESFTMYLSGESEESGRAYVTVTDRDGMPLAGISVSLVAVGGTIEGIRETPSSGTANFTDVPAGRYYVTAYDTTGTYAEYDSRNSGYDGTKDLLPGGALDFRVVLEDEVIGTIKLQVLDSGTLAGIAGAEVTLSKDGAVIDTEYSDNAGMLEFKVGEDVGYDLSFDKEGYLIESLKDVKPGTDYRKVMLTPATEENSMSLAVSVVDEGKGAVEDVRLRLKIASDGTPVGDEIATGANGKAVFERLEEGNYYVYAYKPGFGEENSGNVYVSAREENSVEIVLRIGKGNIEANVLDAQKQAVAGASVKLVNFRTMETMESKVADSKGYVKFEVRADKKVFLVVNAAGFMSHTTIPVMPVKDVTRKFEISLEKAVSGLQVKFMGLYVGDQRIGDADGLVNAGGLYTAKMLLLIPAGSSFGEAGAHFRTGAADSGIMEKDYLYITNVRAAYDSVIRGTSYNPPNGYAKDAEHFTSGNAKWANVYFADAAGGVYEIEMDVQVSDAAPNGAALDAWYRGWGKSGSYIRFPSDRALGGAESNAEKHGLYAQANNRKYTVGLASPCYENFCASFTIEDLAEQIKTAVMDEYVADEGANYRLAFSITSTSESMLSGAKLRISDNVGSLALGGYEVITAAGERMKDDAKGRAIEIDAGDIAKDGIIQG
ncbi:carboxypeptidase-like regulatory domain-containing protein, partial [Candidatus Micrarchaeota archaeon]|nr:carboxypeptidase-like regulatory domain-containing protein [Candidatus Micrarchaeota archaeon]